MLHIYDGMNVVRHQLENDPSGRVPRKLLNEMWAMRTGDVALWVWDGKGGKQARQALYPDYKAKRNPQPDFVWKTIELIQDVLKHTRVIQVTAPGFEADDVIAHYTRDYAPDVMIHSTDRDFAQLGVKGTWNPLKEGLTHDLVRLYKTWVGDPSDNIRGVPGFGDGAWAKADKSELLDITLGTGPIPGGLTPGVRNWLASNRDELATLWTITGFLPVPDATLAPIIGSPNYQAAHEILLRFMQ